MTQTALPLQSVGWLVPGVSFRLPGEGVLRGDAFSLLSNHLIRVHDQAPLNILSMQTPFYTFVALLCVCRTVQENTCLEFYHRKWQCTVCVHEQITYDQVEPANAKCFSPVAGSTVRRPTDLSGQALCRTYTSAYTPMFEGSFLPYIMRSFCTPPAIAHLKLFTATNFSIYLVIRPSHQTTIFASLSPVFFAELLGSFQLNRDAVSMHRKLHFARLRSSLLSENSTSLSETLLIAFFPLELFNPNLATSD